MEGVEETDSAPTGASRARPSLDADILDRLGDAILVTDMRGRYVDVNLAATRLLGYSRAELLGMSIADVAAWPVERAEAEFERFTATGMWRDQVELRRKDGSTVTVDARASVIETAGGRWGLAILREPDPAIAELREAERRLAALVRSSDDAIYSVSPEGVIETWNPAAEHLYGYRADEIVGKHVRTTAPPERHEEVHRNVERVLRGERVEGFETVRLRKDGRRIDVALTISPILDPDGRVIGMSTIGRDIGERIRAERWARSLTELSTTLREAGSVEELLDAALDSLQRGLRAGQVGVLLSDDGAPIRFRRWRGLSVELRSVLEELDLPAAAGTDPLSVPDVRLEERFAARRDAFERVGCRSFVAIALARAAEPVGAVVVCSDRAGELAPDELGFAVALCAQLSVAVARLRAERALEATRDTLDLLTARAADGITIQDATGRVVYANLSAARLTGYDSVEAFLRADPGERIADLEMLDERGEPFPLERLPGRRVLQGEPEAEAIVLVRSRRTGRSFWSLVKATASFDDRGAVRYAINLFHDVTRQKEAELTSHLRARRMAQLYSFTAALSSTTDARVVAEALADLTETGFAADRGAVLLRGEDGTTLEPLAARGYPAEEVERFGAAPLDRRTPIGQAVLGNEPVVMSDADAWRAMHPDLDEPLPPAAAAIPLDVGDRAIGVVVLAYDEPRIFDDDDVVFMQAAARQGAQALERARVEAGRRLVQTRLSILARAGELFAQSLDYARTLASATDLIVPRLADWAAVDILEPDGEIRQFALAHVNPEKVAIAREFRRRFPPSPDAPTGVGHVISTGEPELLPEITEETLSAIEDPQQRRLIEDLRLRSAMVVPLTARGRTLGALSFVWAESGNTYSGADLEFAQVLAARMALVIDNARLFRDRDHVARTLQRSLLPPDLPGIDGIELAARYRPSGEGLEVGGDFYDAFDIGDDEWTLALGDVCGKGSDAATLMGMVRHTIRAAAIRERAPSRVLATVNAAVARQTPDDRFCTAVAARLRRRDGRTSVWLAVAGHPPPLLRRADGAITWVAPTGALLGVLEDPELSDVELTLAPGDVLVLYTDGVIEERGASGDVAREGLVAVVERAAGGTADEIADAIESAVRETDPSGPGDDVAILVLRVTG